MNSSSYWIIHGKAFLFLNISENGTGLMQNFQTNRLLLISILFRGILPDFLIQQALQHIDNFYSTFNPGLYRYKTFR